MSTCVFYNTLKDMFVQICWTFRHPRCRRVCFFIGRNLETCCITSLAQQLILYSRGHQTPSEWVPFWWHPFTVEQGSPSSVLEGQCPAEFSSNPNQTVLKYTGNSQAGVLRQVGAKLCRTPALRDRTWWPLLYSEWVPSEWDIKQMIKALKWSTSNL